MTEMLSAASEPPKAEELGEFGKKLAGFEDTPLLSEPGPSSKSYTPKYLTRLQKFSFGLGHVINDIMGVLWFSFALTFLQIVVQLRPAVSASLLFFGKYDFNTLSSLIVSMSKLPTFFTCMRIITTRIIIKINK